MKAVKIIAIVLISLISLITATLFLIGYFKEKPGGVFIDTDPLSNVYINDILVGKTPYKSTHPAGQITIKLVPVSPNLVAYETRLILVPGIETIVRREFGESEGASSGDVISFDKIEGKEVGLIIISTPENAQVSVDGIPQGFTPYKNSSISPAQHQITIRSPGYTDRVMTVQTLAGYRLSLYAKLAKSVETKSVVTSVPEMKTYVEILKTPTGFLRVRTAPGAAGSEIAQVKPGERYAYLSDDAATGWIEIQYEASAAGLPNGITGWVSGQYSKKVEATSSASLLSN